MSVFNFLWAFLNVPRGARGQAMTEYILIIAIIAVGLIVVFVAFRTQIVNVFHNVMSNLSGDKDTDIEGADQASPDDDFEDFDE